MATITFHSMADSAYLWTAMMVADEKGVDYELVDLVLGSEQHLRLHPFGKMPVLQHGELVLYETLAIANYIDRAFGGPALQPAEAYPASDMWRWISVVNAYVFPVMNRFVKERLVKPAWGFESDRAFLREARGPLGLQIGLIEAAVGRGGFLVGETPTLADCFLLPHLLFFSHTLESAELLDAAPRTRAWLAAMTARDTYQRSPMRQAFETFHNLPAGEVSLWTDAG